MKSLPPTIVTDDGLSVAGAGAALLEELLAEYQALIALQNPAVPDALAPGRTESEVRAMLEPAFPEPNSEIVTWWMWCDGAKPDSPIPARNIPLPLEQAIASYRRQPRGTLDGTQWNPAWMPVIVDSRVAMRADRAYSPPLVRPAMPEFGDHTQDSPRPAQVVSLCTPVVWWITALREGWETFDRSAGIWRADRGSYPPEWWATRLV